MIYPFMTLNDSTEITHTEILSDGTVTVYVETPVYGGFHSAECTLPSNQWKNINGYTENELAYYQEFIKSLEDIIIDLAGNGGFDNAANFKKTF